MHNRMEVPYRDRGRAPRWLLGLALGASAITALAIVTIDQPLARVVARYEPLAIWDRILTVLEWGLGLPLVPWTSAIVLALAMIASSVVPRWRHRAPMWMFLAACHLLGRIAMVQMKDLTGRLRPLEWIARGGDETFGWVKGVSFPSGHVVLFASIIIPLVCVWPRARPLLAIVGFVMVARVIASAHFVSDVTGAIALVALVTWLCGAAIRPLPRRA